MGGRPRKQVRLELTELQCLAVMRALTGCPFSAKSEAALKAAEAKVLKAFRAWQKEGCKRIIMILTEGQGRAVLAALTDDQVGPSTGAWRTAHKKVRKAMGVWEAKSQA